MSEEDTHKKVAEGPLIHCIEDAEGRLRTWLPNEAEAWKKRMASVMQTPGGEAYAATAASYVSSRPTGYYAAGHHVLLTTTSCETSWSTGYYEAVNPDIGEPEGDGNVLWLGCEAYAQWKTYSEDSKALILGAIAEANKAASGKKIKHWYKAPKKRLRLKKVGQHKKQVIFVIGEQSHRSRFPTLKAANGIQLNHHSSAPILSEDEGYLYVLPKTENHDDTLLQCSAAFFTALKDAAHEWETGEKRPMPAHWTDDALKPLVDDGVTVAPTVRYGMRAFASLQEWFDSLSGSSTGAKFFKNLKIGQMRTLLRFEKPTEVQVTVTQATPKPKVEELVKEAV